MIDSRVGEDGKNALKVATAILELLEPETNTRTGKAAWNLVNEDFTIEAVTATLRRTYEDVARRSGDRVKRSFLTGLEGDLPAVEAHRQREVEPRPPVEEPRRYRYMYANDTSGLNGALWNSCPWRDFTLRTCSLTSGWCSSHASQSE